MKSAACMFALLTVAFVGIFAEAADLRASDGVLGNDENGRTRSDRGTNPAAWATKPLMEERVKHSRGVKRLDVATSLAQKLSAMSDKELSDYKPIEPQAGKMLTCNNKEGSGTGVISPADCGAACDRKDSCHAYVHYNDQVSMGGEPTTCFICTADDLRPTSADTSKQLSVNGDYNVDWSASKIVKNAEATSDPKSEATQPGGDDGQAKDANASDANAGGVSDDSPAGRTLREALEAVLKALDAHKQAKEGAVATAEGSASKAEDEKVKATSEANAALQSMKKDLDAASGATDAAEKSVGSSTNVDNGDEKPATK